MGVLKYSSNNSGGSWWLTDQNWKDLEASGWVVFYSIQLHELSVLNFNSVYCSSYSIHHRLDIFSCLQHTNTEV